MNEMDGKEMKDTDGTGNGNKDDMVMTVEFGMDDMALFSEALRFMYDLRDRTRYELMEKEGHSGVFSKEGVGILEGRGKVITLISCFTNEYDRLYTGKRFAASLGSEGSEE